MPGIPLSTIPIVFDAGTPYSRVASLGGYAVGLICPTDWTPAPVTILVSPEGDNYYDLFDGVGHEATFNVTPGVMLNVDPNLLMMAAHIRLRSGTRGHEVPQEAGRQFFIVTAQQIATVE